MDALVTTELIEAALQLAQAPEGGQVLAAVMRGDGLALLVDYGIGGVKKWVIPAEHLPSQQAALQEVPPVEVEREEPSQAPPPEASQPESPQPEPARPAMERKRRRK